jgi:hypothetical protein
MDAEQYRKLGAIRRAATSKATFATQAEAYAEKLRREANQAAQHYIALYEEAAGQMTIEDA